MLFRFLFLLVFGTLNSIFSAQAQEVEPLLAEREKLMQQYEYYSSQKSNFWGKQSKKDLLQVIDVLKEIIRNDTKLVTAYKNEKLRHTADLTAQNKQLNQQVKSDRGIIEEEFYTLQNQVKTQQNKLKLRDQKITELESAYQYQKRAANRAEQFMFVMGILLASSLGYIFFSLKGRNGRTKARR